MNKIIRREIEVAFSKHAQPIWFRLAKYVVLITVFYFFWNSAMFWIIFAALFVIAIMLHLWYRYKTKGWTRDYGMWNYEKNKSRLNIRG